VDIPKTEQAKIEGDGANHQTFGVLVIPLAFAGATPKASADRASRMFGNKMNSFAMRLPPSRKKDSLYAVDIIPMRSHSAEKSSGNKCFL
jgi:hypothetical protein